MELLNNLKYLGKDSVSIVGVGADSSVRDQIGQVDTVGGVGGANDFAEITLYDNGIIKSCSKACADLLGCAVNSLTMHHVSKILPQLAEVVLIKGDRVNPYLRFLSRADHHFEVVAMTGSRFLCALFFSDIEDFGRHCMRIIFRPLQVQ